jgi:hypothetical protein
MYNKIRILSNIKPRIRLLVPQAKLSVYIDWHRRNFSVLRAKLIVLPRLEAFKVVVKLLKWIKLLTLDLDVRPSTLDNYTNSNYKRQLHLGNEFHSLAPSQQKLFLRSRNKRDLKKALKCFPRHFKSSFR